MKVPAPQYRSIPSSLGCGSSASMTRSMRISAALVFTWKNEGADRRMFSSPIFSVQEPSPARASTPATRRARFSPLDMTRTTLVARTASPNTRETWARGNAPVGVHRATSSAPVRRLERMPTRSSSRSRELPRKPRAPVTALIALACFLLKRGQVSTLMIWFGSRP